MIWFNCREIQIDHWYSDQIQYLYMDHVDINEQQINFGISTPPYVLKGYQGMLLSISIVFYDLIQVVVIWVLCHAISEVLKIGRGQTNGQCLGKINLVQTQYLIGQKASLDDAINYSNIGCAKLSIPGAAFLPQRKILAQKMYTISVGWLELVICLKNNILYFPTKKKLTANHGQQL